jgi:hypothetical protein
MKYRFVAASMVLGCATLVYAGAQTAPQPQDSLHDWGGVVLLAPRTPISVQIGKYWHACSFGSANGEWLECASGGAGRFAGRTRMYRREKVRRVRFEEKEESTLAGALIGTGVGVGLGALGGGSKSGMTQGGSELFGGFLGAIVGGVIGHDAPLVHGRVIYERPTENPASGPAQR